MKTLYAKQLYDNYFNDAYYDMLVNDSESTNDFFIYGNKDFIGINGGVIKYIKDNIVNYSLYEVESYYKNNLCAYIIDYLKQYKKISLKSAIKIMQLLKSDDNNGSAIICATLEAIFNKRYKKTIIRGACQSDWNYLFYAIDYIDNEQRDYIEAVYFNCGYEIEYILIDDNSDNMPQCADDIEGEYICVASLWNIKEYLKKHFNCDNVVFYEIKDIKTITTYKLNYEVL